MNEENYWYIGIGLVVAILIFFAIKLGTERQKWLDNHCKVIGEMSGSVGTAVTTTSGKIGVGTVYIPGKTGYKCDNNKEYWE